MYDIIIIVAEAARELSRCQVGICVMEKEEGVCCCKECGEALSD